MRDIAATLIGAIPDFSHVEAQSFIENKGSAVKDVQNVLNEFLIGGPEKLWKIFAVGRMSREEILKQLSSRFKVKNWAVDMIEDERFYLSERSREVNLCLVSVKELGFFEEPTLNQIYVRAGEFNLSLCPPEVGPILWMLLSNTKDVKNGFNIAMDPIPDREGMSIFHLGSGWLHSVPAFTSVNKKWRLDSKFVFEMSDS
jgi:hypothetical protein